MTVALTTKQISDFMREMGRKGGRARMHSMSDEERSASARKAAKAMWKKRRQEEKRRGK